MLGYFLGTFQCRPFLARTVFGWQPPSENVCLFVIATTRVKQHPIFIEGEQEVLTPSRDTNKHQDQWQSQYQHQHQCQHQNQYPCQYQYQCQHQYGGDRTEGRRGEGPLL